MSTTLKDAQRIGVQRLNEKQPMHPPDTTFIKSNMQMLDKYVNSPMGTMELSMRATPNQAKRFELF